MARTHGRVHIWDTSFRSEIHARQKRTVIQLRSIYALICGIRTHWNRVSFKASHLVLQKEWEILDEAGFRISQICSHFDLRLATFYWAPYTVCTQLESRFCSNLALFNIFDGRIHEHACHAVLSACWH